MDKKNIYVLPLGDINLGFFEKLKQDLKKRFGFEVQFKDRVEIPDYAYDKSREQYKARIILNELAGLKFEEAEKILAITDVDLFTEDLNFIFGQAEASGKFCLIATKRLNPEFYQKKFDQSLFYRWILKEAVHELGHTFGLKHCENKKCVMSFSNNIEDVDSKKSEFCEECKRMYEYMNR